MDVAPLTAFSVTQIASVMREGRPWLPESTDYWLWQCCFGTTSFIASSEGTLAGGVLACVNQSKADEVYVDQVTVHKQWRGCGVTGHLLQAVADEARRLGCKRVWLSTDPENPAALVWPRYGFSLLPGNDEVNRMQVTRDFKGPGKHRALFERRVA